MAQVGVLIPSRNAALALANALCGAGYGPPEGVMDELVAYEFMWRRQFPGGAIVEVDLHWRMSSSPLFGNLFTFDELMADSMALPSLAPNALRQAAARCWAQRHSRQLRRESMAEGSLQLPAFLLGGLLRNDAGKSLSG